MFVLAGQTEMLVCSLDLGKLWGLKLSVLTGWPVCHWLVGEGPFVHQDKEEIEKFLGGPRRTGIYFHGDSLL